MLPEAFEVRVLGPVEVVGPSGPVSLGRPRQRALLGLLALRARQVVSRAALIDGLWDADPPDTALKTLHSHMAHLRRGLAEGGLGGLIGTRAPGYLLDVPTEYVDAHRFSEIVEYAPGDPAARAAQRLRAALGMWRGDVLADCVVGEWARAEAARLVEARMYATEELYRAELDSGRHALAAELEALVAQNPLRERFWELLMLALYRAGRQGDALAAYQRARAALVSELGVEPGPGLRRLEAMILAGEEAPLPRENAVVASAPWVPGGTVPAPVTSLIGRGKDVAELTGLLTERRLVTLTGVGGCGKTRLAIAVATELAGPVCFVDLTAVAEADLVPAAVHDALALRGEPTTETLIRDLRGRELLLVLDNCEHLRAGCTDFVETLLRSCPRLRVLATSREPLAVWGETIWPVQPLPVPTPDVRRLVELHDYDAVRLFLDRAALPAVRELTDADAPAVAAICAGLDGLPLALELAAARTAVLTMDEIAQRLRDPSLLRSHQRADRHRALDATISWSYGCLDPEAQSGFRRLAVFASGFTLAAVEAVWPDDRSLVDVLADLVAKSLVVLDRQGEPRYRMLETIRHFAADRLSAEESRLARQRHAAHYLALATGADRHLRGPDCQVWLDRLGADHENLRSALAWYAGEPEELRLAVALARYCRMRGRYREGRQWLLAALERCPNPAADRAPALLSVASFSYLEGSYARATSYASQALDAFRDLADPAGTARSLRLLGSIACERGEYGAATSRYADALTAYHCLDDDGGRADIAQMTGFVAWLSGDFARAEPLLDKAMRQYGALDDVQNVSSTRVHLAAVALYQDDPAKARWLAQTSLTHFTSLGFMEGIAWARNIIGLAALRENRPHEALSSLRQSLRQHTEIGDRWRQASLLEALAAAHLSTTEAPHPIRAAELLGLATALRDDLGTPVPAAELPAWQKTQSTLTERLTNSDRIAALTRGATHTVTDALTYS
jgi:predicted ATPase/DNA-binding SARP family transcriptional activator